ncbi:MAG TPA: YMGG-like glycine zipper-containing protein [Burkholderiales bacterium]|nr:YMGG-like glycine zipper-containing protein [Burkholderiales bacterium]
MKRILPLLSILALGACATVPPSGPSVMVLPGDGKTFEQFRADDFECRQFASSQAGGTSQQAAVDSGVKSAAIGTAVGAVAGALIGGHQGAGAGAGAGLVVGSVAGTGAAERSAYTLQQRYDIAYTQCMYAKGNKVPAAADERPLRRRRYYMYPPPG